MAPARHNARTTGAGFNAWLAWAAVCHWRRDYAAACFCIHEIENSKVRNPADYPCDVGHAGRVTRDTALRNSRD